MLYCIKMTNILKKVNLSKNYLIDDESTKMIDICLISI